MVAVRILAGEVILLGILKVGDDVSLVGRGVSTEGGGEVCSLLMSDMVGIVASKCDVISLRPSAADERCVVGEDGRAGGWMR